MPDEKESPQYSLFKVEEQAPVDTRQTTTSSSRYSDFIVYVDESGDHGMETLDANYPMFVLAFCVFYKRHYAEHVVPALEKFKFNHFGHDLVVLHEHEIRKETGAFRFVSRQQKEDFLGELTGIIEHSNFILISCVINKDALKRSGTPPNPYHLALSFCLEALYELMEEKNQGPRKTHVVFERRGDKEDKELELEFRRICDGANRHRISLPFSIIFGDKRVNSSGLQLADLVARPIGLSVLRPNQTNRAFEILKRKLFCEGGRSNVGAGYEGKGLRVIPSESEKPR